MVSVKDAGESRLSQAKVLHVLEGGWSYQCRRYQWTWSLNGRGRGSSCSCLDLTSPTPTAAPPDPIVDAGKIKCPSALTSLQQCVSVVTSHDRRRHEYPPSKRARSLRDQDSSPLHALLSPFSLPNFERHTDFWFDDGNVVFIVQNTGFHIYRGLLATQSTVFADLFASASASAD